MKIEVVEVVDNVGVDEIDVYGIEVMMVIVFVFVIVFDYFLEFEEAIEKVWKKLVLKFPVLVEFYGVFYKFLQKINVHIESQ